MQTAATDDSAKSKAWRLSASVIILAPRSSVPDCALTGLVSNSLDAHDYRVCLLKRAARSSFMPDAIVFPGGAVDSDDLVSASALCDGHSRDEAAIRCCAVREAFEESGVGIFEPPLRLDDEELAAWRRRVHGGPAELRALCNAAGTSPATQSLHYWCSFITPDMEHQRLKKGGFDARFFVWCAPPDESGAPSHLRRAQADAQETTQLIWLTPKEALAAVEKEHIVLIPPQWYILKELADACPRMAMVPSYAGSAERILQRDYPIKPYPVALTESEKAVVLGRLQRVDETKPPPVFALVYPGDEQHPVFPGPSGARHRMTIVGELGKQSQYELARDVPNSSLPLQEIEKNWYALAKL